MSEPPAARRLPAAPTASAPAPPAASAPASPAARADDAAEELQAERIVDSVTVHRGHYLDVRVETTERADGSRHRRDVVHHPGAVAIVARDERDRVVMVRQWRQPAGRSLLEIPAGTLDRDPATGELEDPELASRRELEEETGLRAATWQKLATFWTAPGFASELMHLYLATDLEPAGHGRLAPDADEALEVIRLPVAEALAAADRGDILDAKTLVGILLLGRRPA
jgi:ADP-ribose pyrophosphatase